MCGRLSMQDVSNDSAVLGVRPGASWEEVRRAYLDLVAVWNPERFATDRRLHAAAQQKIERIEAAYRRLGAQPESAEPAAVAAPREEERGGPFTVSWSNGPSAEAKKLLTSAAVCALVGWLGVMHYLWHPARSSAPIATRTGSLRAAPAALFSEKVIEVTAVTDPARGEKEKSRLPNVRPETGAALIARSGEDGNGMIQIRNRHSTDIVADIVPWNGERRVVRSVYVRSGEETVLTHLGLGLYQASFHTAFDSEPGGRSVAVSYRLADPMRLYEVRMAGETQSVRYIVTVP